jgi:hypothetical protein
VKTRDQQHLSESKLFAGFVQAFLGMDLNRLRPPQKVGGSYWSFERIVQKVAHRVIAVRRYAGNVYFRMDYVDVVLTQYVQDQELLALVHLGEPSVM